MCDTDPMWERSLLAMAAYRTTTIADQRTASNNPVAPIPPPTHMVTTP
jgi:hypothetical protein